jgi:TolB-like protein/tetratricopeptide (TPR) repeat protein
MSFASPSEASAHRAGAPMSKEVAERIRQQLSRIMASATFQKVDRLKRFVNFIVVEAVAGRSDQLKEYVVGTEVFGKDQSFDPRNDPIVRVQARRLRARLDQYFREEGLADEFIIELPKGGYVPAFKPRPSRDAQKPAATPLIGQNCVAVLTFADHSPDGVLAHVCKGIRQEIVHQLTQIKALRVIAWDPTESRGIHDPREDSRSLGAAMLISGSVAPLPRKLRVTTQLIDTVSGCYKWSESTEHPKNDVPALQMQVASLVISKMRGEIPASTPAVPAGRPTVNLTAHNLYRQGRYHLEQRSEEGLLKAKDFFQKALVEDPQYALALSGLADAYGLLTHYGVLPPDDAWAKAASSAEAAVMLDGASAEARTSLAHVKSTQGWDWRGAEQEFQRAIAIDPRYATAHHWYAMSCLAPMGRLDEALEQIQLAQSLDPVSPIIARDLTMIRYYRREFDEALEQCDHTIELNPHFSAGYWTLGLVQEQRGDFEESTAAFQRALLLSPHSPKMHGAMGRTFALSGQTALANGILKELRGLSKSRYVSPCEFALIHFALKQPDLGFRWLSKASADRCFDLTAINVDPRFDPIRRDRRFVAVAREVGLS